MTMWLCDWEEVGGGSDIEDEIGVDDAKWFEIELVDGGEYGGVGG